VSEPIKMPPGPRGRVRCSIRLAKDPINAVREWRAEYGDTFRVPILGGDWVVTCEPERIRQVFTNRDSEVFRSSFPDAAGRLLGPRSLPLTAGGEHPRDRKLMLPPFHGERMRVWARTMAEASRWAFLDTDGHAVKALDHTRQATLDVILRVVFGVHDEDRRERFREAVKLWLSSFNPILIFLPILQHDWLGLSPYARFRRRSEHLNALLREQIAVVRASPGSTDDVLAMLVEARYDDGEGMDDAKLVDNLRTLLFAGHDTTAVTLAWAIELVHRHPSVLTRLRAELDTLGDAIEPDALTRLPYLDAVIDETLRFRPPGDVLRTLRMPWTFGEWRLAPNTTININSHLLHFDDQHWDRPFEFVPERFLASPPSPNVFVPFGGGSRRCLGATFARYELPIMLGTLLREFEFELLDERVEWNRGRAILEPLGGVNVRVRRRSAVRAAA
jgi:cytochrome P450